MKSLRVLVAEDNPINQKVLVRLLQRLGCEVSAVSNGAEALHFVKTGTWDMVLMDLQMPVMDGLEASRRIRAETESDIVIVAISACSELEYGLEWMASGMNERITKPAGFPELRDLVTKYSKESCSTL
jgi:CheY-like chemotaxis protein